MSNQTGTRAWDVTPWQISDGRWVPLRQPIILVDGEPPYFAAHPKDYMNKLQELHGRADLMPGYFHKLIGELRDVIELGIWVDTEEQHAESIGKNGRRPSLKHD